jgi:hypothetical protein
VADLLTSWGLSAGRSGDSVGALHFHMAAHSLVPSEYRYIIAAGVCCLKAGQAVSAISLFRLLLPLELTPRQVDAAQDRLEEAAALPAAAAFEDEIIDIAEALADEPAARTSLPPGSASRDSEGMRKAAAALVEHATELDSQGHLEEAQRVLSAACRLEEMSSQPLPPATPSKPSTPQASMLGDALHTSRQIEEAVSDPADGEKVETQPDVLSANTMEADWALAPSLAPSLQLDSPAEEGQQASHGAVQDAPGPVEGQIDTAVSPSASPPGETAPHSAESGVSAAPHSAEPGVPAALAEAVVTAPAFPPSAPARAPSAAAVNAQPALSIAVDDHFERDGVWFYSVSLHTPRQSLIRAVRYSELLAFHGSLDASTRPTFPGKRIGHAQDRAFALLRRQELNAYVGLLVMTAGADTLQRLSDFLNKISGGDTRPGPRHRSTSPLLS